MKKIISILVVSILTLAGCGNSSEASSSAEQLVLWGGFSGEEEAALNETLEIYNANNGDDLDVVYESQQDLNTKLLTSMSTGDGPDIVIWDRLNTITYAKQDAFLPIDEFLSASNIDTTQYYEQAYNELNVDGVQYGVPMTVDTRVLFYNKDLFDQANLDYPTNDWTWDDMYKAAEACTVVENGDLKVSGFDLSDAGLFNMWLYQAGGEMADPATNKMTFNTEYGKTVLKEWQKYLDAGIYKNGYIGGESGIQDAFASGNVCMKYDGPWALTSLKEQNTNFQTVTAAQGPSGKSTTILGGFGFLIPKSSADAQQSYNFITEWTTNEEIAESFYSNAGHLPANQKTILNNTIQADENVAVITEQLKDAIARPQMSMYGDAEYFGLKASLDKFMAGEVSIDEALEQGAKDADQYLSEGQN